MNAIHRFTHQAMACEWDVFVAHADGEYCTSVARAVFAEVDRLEDELSFFRPGSDVYELNAAPPGQPVRVRPDTWAVLRLARAVWRLTDGAFDVTRTGRRPLGEAGTAVYGDLAGWGVRLHRSTHGVARRGAGLCVDLGAIGKGYAVDRALEILRDWGFECALVQAGLSTAAALAGPMGGWRVALRGAISPDAAAQRLNLSHRAISGSGCVLHGDHIVDPRNPARTLEVRAAWAISSNAALSDAMSTAAMIMPSKRVDACCRRVRDLTILVDRDGGAFESYGAGLRDPQRVRLIFDGGPKVR